MHVVRRFVCGVDQRSSFICPLENRPVEIPHRAPATLKQAIGGPGGAPANRAIQHDGAGGRLTIEHGALLLFSFRPDRPGQMADLVFLAGANIEQDWLQALVVT